MLAYADLPQHAYTVTLNNGTSFGVSAAQTLRLYASNTLAVLNADGSLAKAWAGASVWLAVTPV